MKHEFEDKHRGYLESHLSVLITIEQSRQSWNDIDYKNMLLFIEVLSMIEEAEEAKRASSPKEVKVTIDAFVSYHQSLFFVDLRLSSFFPFSLICRMISCDVVTNSHGSSFVFDLAFNCSRRKRCILKQRSTPIKLSHSYRNNNEQRRMIDVNRREIHL